MLQGIFISHLKSNFPRDLQIREHHLTILGNVGGHFSVDQEQAYSFSGTWYSHICLFVVQLPVKSWIACNIDSKASVNMCPLMCGKWRHLWCSDVATLPAAVVDNSAFVCDSAWGCVVNLCSASLVKAGICALTTIQDFNPKKNAHIPALTLLYFCTLTSLITHVSSCHIYHQSDKINTGSGSIDAGLKWPWQQKS